MRKPYFCICENKDADQLCGNRTADQRLCFRYIDSPIPLLSKSEISSVFHGHTAQFVSDLVGNPEDRFCPDAAHICFHTASLSTWSHTQNHYANMSMQYAANFKGYKNDKFKMKKEDVFIILLKI